MDRQDSYLVFVIDPSIFQQTGRADIGNLCRPLMGWGGRAFSCERYEQCLTIAANGDWQGFHCESCVYKKRGFLSFYLQEFFKQDPEDEAPAHTGFLH